MLSEEQLRRIGDVYQKRMQNISGLYFRKMGEHIKHIGTLTPSDVHRLTEMRRAGMDLAEIQRMFTEATQTTAREMQSLFAKVAEEDYRLAEQYMFRRPFPNIHKNKVVMRIIEAQYKQTAGTLFNLSRTTIDSKLYRATLDDAIQAVHSGISDYQSAIRNSVRRTASRGLTVKYPNSGTTRRLDTAVRQNVLDGVRQLQADVTRQVGEEFGADGVELSAHALCAEDHLPFQGLQFSKRDFDALQSTLDRPIGQWNCKHFVFPVLLGVSPPTHPPTALERYRNNSTENVTINGRAKTRYEWSQEQRRIETEVRRQKDIANLAKSSGDDTLRREAQAQIDRLSATYTEVSEAAGLIAQHERMGVAGFRRVKAARVQAAKAPGVTHVTKTTKVPQYSGNTVKFAGVECRKASEMYSLSQGMSNRTAPPVDVTTYTTPDGTKFIFPTNYDPANQTMTPEQAISAWYKVPEEVRVRAQKVVEIVDYPNPLDDYWRKHYANFSSSYATGGDAVTFYRYGKPHDLEYVTRTFCHEAAHLIDMQLADNGERFSAGIEWMRASRKDKSASGLTSITIYGNNSPAEDFAESLAVYINNEDLFRKTMPNRAGILDWVLGRTRKRSGVK